MVTIATHILNKYLPNKTLPTYTFLSCKQLTKLLQQQYKKTGHSPLNTTISQHLVKIHLIGEQIQNISDLQSADITNPLNTQPSVKEWMAYDWLTMWPLQPK